MFPKLGHLILCMLDNFSRICFSLLTFFKMNFLKKFFLEHYQSVKRFASRSGPTFWIWVQTFCKGYQQMTEVTASKERDKFIKTSCGGDTISSCFYELSVNEMIVSLF